MMDFRGGFDDGVEICVRGGKALPSEIKCLEGAIKEEVALPITKGNLACSILLESRRL